MAPVPSLYCFVILTVQRRSAVQYALLCFAVAAENINNLVLDKLSDIVSARSKILTRIEMLGMFVEVLADSRGHSKTEVGVDVDLADSHGSSLTEHIFGDTDSIGHSAAVGVDDVNIFLWH